jgi:predicted dehydrogenase
MTNTIIRIGMIGAGGWANLGHLNFYKKHPKVKVVAICDVVAERAESAAREFGIEFTTTDYNEVLARTDIDAVDIATSNVMHAPVALAALKAGKHIICEKPMAMSYAEALSMAEAARKTPLKSRRESVVGLKRD